MDTVLSVCTTHHSIARVSADLTQHSATWLPHHTVRSNRFFRSGGIRVMQRAFLMDNSDDMCCFPLGDFPEERRIVFPSPFLIREPWMLIFMSTISKTVWRFFCIPIVAAYDASMIHCAYNAVRWRTHHRKLIESYQQLWKRCVLFRCQYFSNIWTKTTRYIFMGMSQFHEI